MTSRSSDRILVGVLPLVAAIALTVVGSPLAEDRGARDEARPAAAEASETDEPAPDSGTAKETAAGDKTCPVRDDDRTATRKGDGTSTDGEKEEPLRFTNADLPSVPRMYERDTADREGRDDRSRRKNSARKRDDATGAGAASAVEEEGLQLRRRALQARAVALEERIAYLEARLFALRNPLHRGQTPARPEEEDAVGGMSNVARVEWVQEQIDAAKNELQETRAELATLPRP